MRNDREHDRLESTWDRWRQLPLGYRVNACLYVLAFVALIGLLAQVVSDSGDKPRQVDVASRAPTTTRPRPTTTAPKASSTTAPTSTTAPKAAAPAPPAAGSSGSNASSGSKTSSAPRPSGSGAAQPADTLPIPGLPLTPSCLNSSDPACGDFRWDPPASPNMPITISVQPAQAANVVNFSVDVADGDHVVTDNCAVVDFGDGNVQRLPCQPLNCPPTFGPWIPPGRVPGHATFSYGHAYAPGSYQATFEFHTDRDKCPDPYGNYGRAVVPVGVPAG